ncbi:mu-type opioid receptor-like [Solea senegalensis]|uniref:Mu-type opioid receptor-like n=1 Tax=Solea senegalensis TaxID=28829 RepID=A0AAV6PVD2_SOLSE|nr:odorant receptor 131-2-like [Solea senegalensis]KAG7478658.1 mu-type opioid receptor-like [Solea senegalensis]
MVLVCEVIICVRMASQSSAGDTEMNSNNTVFGPTLAQRHSKVIIVQVLVVIFLCINLLLIVTFFKNQSFYTTARYILFAVTLLSDSFLFLVSDLLFIFAVFQVTMWVSLCSVICIIMGLYLIVTPVTLTAMTLERYVAICMPLRHTELCSTRNTLHVILVIHGLSSVPYAVVLFTFFASASLDFYYQYRICSVEILIVYKWQDHVRSAVFQFYFLIMCLIIMLCYVKVMQVARTASDDDKISSKGLKTVTLHAFQLLLCLIQFWYPLIMSSLIHIDFTDLQHVRFFSYIMFNLAPRCLSPLIYGLRDEMFFTAMKKCLSCGLCDRQ